jgi:hypothetical protein
VELPNFGITAVLVTQIGAVAIDVSISQTHRFPSRITENPVEDGTVFADHVVLLPAILEIDGRVTDAPISIANVLIGKPGAQDAYNELVRMQKAREPFEVVTGLNVYRNMLLEDLSIPRTAQDGKSIRFTAVMREILIIGKDVPTNRDMVAENVRHTALPVTNNGMVSRILS